MRAKRRNHFISFISFAAMAGMALGVTALITVLSVMNGFQTEVRARLFEATSHVDVLGNPYLTRWQALYRRVKLQPHIIGVAPYVSSEGLLLFEGQVQGALIRGVDPNIEAEVSDIGQHMFAGHFKGLRADRFNIVLGVSLAQQLGVKVGDYVTLVAPEGQATPAGLLPRLKRFRIVGLFRVDLYGYDAKLAFIHLADAQKLYRLGEAISGLRIRVDNAELATRVRLRLLALLPPEIQATDWTLQHAHYFRAVQIEKTIMFIILTLIIAVAAFNLVSTLVMVVTDKQADIAILRTFGATPASIMAIFMVQGILTGLCGTTLGVVGGVVLSTHLEVVVPWLEKLLDMRFLTREIYLISDLPSNLLASDVWLVAAVALSLSFVATLYPSWRAGRLPPAEALRYE